MAGQEKSKEPLSPSKRKKLRKQKEDQETKQNLTQDYAYTGIPGAKATAKGVKYSQDDVPTRLSKSDEGNKKVETLKYKPSKRTLPPGKSILMKAKGGRAGYKHGGSPQGYGAARTSGMGLQDEELKPGKVYKAKRGSGLDLPVINSVKPTVNKTKRAQNLSEMKIQFTKQKNRTGINSGTLDKILSKTKNPYSDLKATTAKGPTQYSSMDEMRQAKGFKPGESNTAFLKRRMDLRAATKAVSATKIGKIALGVGAAGVAASQYLKSKMKKDKNEKTLKDFREQKKPGIPSEKTKTINSALNKLSKKMGGGMMQRPMGYTNGMTDKTFTDPKTAMIAHSMKTKDKISERDRVAAKILEKEAPKGAYSSIINRKKAQDTMLTYAKAKAFKNKGTRLTEKDIEKAKSLIKGMDYSKGSKKPMGYSKGSKKPMGYMGGGMMMQRPMGYRSGTMVKARGCKLGRTRPTKIT